MCDASRCMSEDAAGGVGNFLGEGLFEERRDRILVDAEQVVLLSCAARVD